jgi:hypothetical protein
MERAELERLDREALVLRAQAAGIRRARLLTRPELVDELVRLDPAIDETQLKKSRGFFGRAKDLLSRVVERGLHLPDAADRLRAALGNPLPHVPRPEPQAVPTVTLAEIYAAQGHKQRALETLRRVIEAEPEHGAARALLERLEAVDYVSPAPAMPPETDEARDEIGGNLGPRGDASATESSSAAEAAGALSDEIEPVTTPLDEPTTVPREVREMPEMEEPAPSQCECVAIPASADALYVWWRLSRDATARLADAEAFFVVRAVILVPTWDGPEVSTCDVVCDEALGELFVRDVPPGAVVRVAVGTREDEVFVPLAHSPLLEHAPGRGLVRRTLEGAEPPPADDPEAARIARAAAFAERAVLAGGWSGPAGGIG